MGIRHTSAYTKTYRLFYVLAWGSACQELLRRLQNSSLTRPELIVAQTEPLPKMTMSQSSDALEITLSGAWGMMHENVPESAAVKNALEKQSGIRSIRVNAKEVSGWDALLVAFLYRLCRIAKEAGVDYQTENLPEGVSDLLSDLNAPKETHKPDERENFPFTFRERWHDLTEVAGYRYLAVKGAFERIAAYIGELMMSIGRLLGGHAYFRPKDFVHSLSACGPEALIIVTMISFLVGMTLAFVGLMQLKEFGAEIFVANMVVISMPREMGALMTAIIMAGRTASSYAARLGTMVVNQEVDALQTTGIKPMDFLVLPRVLALVVMMPWLTIYSIAIGILGGAFIAVTMRDLTFAAYWNQTVEAARVNDFYAGMIKSVVFAIMVALAGCYHGLRCGRSSESVGRVTTAAVVSSIVLIILWDSILTVIYDFSGF